MLRNQPLPHQDQFHPKHCPNHPYTLSHRDVSFISMGQIRSAPATLVANYQFHQKHCHPHPHKKRLLLLLLPHLRFHCHPTKMSKREKCLPLQQSRWESVRTILQLPQILQRLTKRRFKSQKIRIIPPRKGPQIL